MFLLRQIFCIFLCVCTLASAQAASPRDIETKGTLTDPGSGQIASNIWSGLNRNDVLLLVKSLPQRYSSPIYYELARRLLLSDAPTLSMASQDAKAAPLDPDKPEILIARLDKLLEMGALRDAETLYDTVVTDTPADFALAYRSLQILMLRGELSAACLDLQAMQGRHGQDPRWIELNRLCRIQFSTGAERERELARTEFKSYPHLGSFLRGRSVGTLNNLSTDDLAFATGLGLVNANTIRQMSPKAGTIQPLLLSVLYNLDTDDETVPEKTCLAIEAVRRGLLTTRELITVYEKPHYDSALLLNIATPPTAAHPCMLPTVLYQRVASNKDAPTRNAAIRQALDMMKNMPDAALWPMAVYFKDLDVRAVANKPYLWRATRILAYEKGELPESWASGWGGLQGGKGVSPFWPVQAIASPNTESSEGFAIWKDQWPSEARRVASRDPVIPLLLGQSLAQTGDKTGKNPKNNLSDYENINTLTFSRSYAIPSYGLTQRLAAVIEKQQTGQSVALLLIGYGAIPPDQVIPHQMALVIDGLNKAGLGIYARRFALEVLR